MTNEYVTRQAVQDTARAIHKDPILIMAVDAVAKAAPGVEVVHGRWIARVDNDTPLHECSVCGARVVKGFYEYENPNLFCYHCGAKMDGGDDNA